MTLMRGGRIVTPEGVFEGDILVKGERIAQVGREIEAPEAEVVDAKGLFVLPGLIDAHVHLRDPGLTHKEDFYTGSCAALAGGVTTVLDMPSSLPLVTSGETLALKQKVAGQKAVVDYGFFLGATKGNVGSTAQVEGVVGLKMFMGGAEGELLVDDFAHQYEHFRGFPADEVVAIHAEDAEALEYFTDLYPGGAHAARRPPICAGLAVARALVMAESRGRRLHICHMSTRIELELIEAVRKRGAKVSCEITPHHLFLTQEDGRRLGNLGKMNPPLRSRAEVEWLWENLDRIDIIASDHAPHTLKEKGGEQAPSGVPGLETMLPLLLMAVNEGRLDWEELARLTSANPARLFRLKGKGRIQAGYDADLVLVAPNEEWRLGESLYTKCGWSPFTGWQVQGRVKVVFLRGREALQEGQILVEGGFGRQVSQQASHGQQALVRGLGD